MINEIIPSKIPGCSEIILKRFSDKRGYFTKVFHEEVFEQMNVKINVAEEYFSYSLKNVFRGLHFQLPPKDHDKIVFCLSGKISDYVVDLRVGSPAYGQYATFELSEDSPKLVFIPKGLAHGFYVHSDHALMQYKVSSVYNEKYDTGISYLSFPFAKDITDPVISERDSAFVSFDNFKSPFKY